MPEGGAFLTSPLASLLVPSNFRKNIFRLSMNYKVVSWNNFITVWTQVLTIKQIAIILTCSVHLMCKGPTSIMQIYYLFGAKHLHVYINDFVSTIMYIVWACNWDTTIITSDQFRTIWPCNTSAGGIQSQAVCPWVFFRHIAVTFYCTNSQTTNGLETT